MGRRGAVASFLLILSLALGAPAAATDVKPYLIPVGDAYAVKALMSVGDRVPLSTDPSQQYQMVGIPDGMALERGPDGTWVLYMNHEFRTDVSTEPVVGAPLHRGAVLSRWVLDPSGTVVSGAPAFDTAYDGDRLVGPAARADNQTPAFGRFCSMVMVGAKEGFDRNIVLTNEEVDAPGGFDPRGGSTVAVFDGEAHALPALGHFSKENSLVMRGTGGKTVIVGLEDGPVTPDSQVYLYVGTKSAAPGASVLRRNGLDNGKLYVLASGIHTKTSEATFTEGTIDIVWREIPSAASLTDVELEAAADALGGMGFVRIEDGAFDLVHTSEMFFTTTGAPDQGNQMGRVYKLRLDPKKATRPGRLSIVTNADLMHPAGSPVPLAPDNVGISRRYLMIQEGGNGKTKPVLVEQARDNSVWRLPLVHGKWRTKVDVGKAQRVAQVAAPGRDGLVVPPGTWESSGIIPAQGAFGIDSWLLTVQTFPPTVEPAPNTFRDGQLLTLMHP